MVDIQTRKFEQLKARLKDYVSEGLIVAFSGGMDSAFLLWAADLVRRESGGKVLALTAVSASMAKVDRDDARRFATSLGVEHVWEESTEVEKTEYARNDTNRCYHCKSELFRIAHDVAGRQGYRHLAYGYTASDRGDIRPGHKAAQEYNVVSPLAEADLAKDEIRVLMRVHGLDLAEKPASPCLSSRLMTGVQVTPERLRDVEALETILRDGGLRIFRVRLHDEGFLRLEVNPEEMALAVQLKDSLVPEAKKRGYRWVTLDLAGYRMGGGVKVHG